MTIIDAKPLNYTPLKNPKVIHADNLTLAVVEHLIQDGEELDSGETILSLAFSIDLVNLRSNLDAIEEDYPEEDTAFVGIFLDNKEELERVIAYFQDFKTKVFEN